jgi:hypothetical protein
MILNVLISENVYSVLSDLSMINVFCFIVDENERVRKRRTYDS